MLQVMSESDYIYIEDAGDCGEVPSIRNVNRIVINRTSVFEKFTPVCPGSDEAEEYFDDTPRWKKVAGGSGFDPNRFGESTEKKYWQMKSHIRRIFNKMMEITLYKDERAFVIRHEPAYRWWVCKGTLNIVRKDLPAPGKR